MNDHVHYFNYHTGRPRFHFEETPPPPPPTPPPTVWHTGADTETIGFWQNKGYDTTDPLKLATKLTEQYRAAERHIGAPPDQIVRMPKADAKPEEFRAFYERLGAPKEAKDYDLSAVKDSTVADSLRAIAHERGLSKDAAAAVATSVAKALESKATTDNTLAAGKLAEQKAKLTVNWGDKYTYNHLQAIEGARKLGITPEAVQALEGAIGYDQVMEAMRKIGANTREDTFIERGAGGAAGDVVTMEGASSRKSELMADKAWSKRYLEGGVAERREMDRLNQMITGVVA